VVLGERTGFVRVARQSGVPIVPIVAHGAHRSAVIFTEGRAFAERIGLQRWGRLKRFPVALALPWIIAPGPWIPYAPLPFRVQLEVLPPMDVPASMSDVDVRDLVQRRMQESLDALADEARRGA